MKPTLIRQIGNWEIVQSFRLNSVNQPFEFPSIWIKNEKTGHCDDPIRYFNGLIAWHNPESVPKKVKNVVRIEMDKKKEQGSRFWNDFKGEE